MKSTQRPFVAGTSRSTRSLTTLLNQMADLERGARIAELRKAKHLTQPAVAELVGVTLRAYQAWEAGGGIAWDNVKLLAKKLGADPDYILSGPKPETPDLFPSGDAGQLDRIEKALEILTEQVEWLTQRAREEDLHGVEQELEDAAERDESPGESSEEEPGAQDG